MRWPRLMHRPRSRHAELDRRLAEADAQRDLSEQRLASVRRHVVAPAEQARNRNQFSDILAASLGLRHPKGTTH